MKLVRSCAGVTYAKKLASYRYSNNKKCFHFVVRSCGKTYRYYYTKNIYAYRTWTKLRVGCIILL